MKAIRGMVQRRPLPLRSRYTRALEAEVARLRAENRALVNSILGVAGIAPMRVSPRFAASLTSAHERSGDAFVGADYRQFAARNIVKTPADAGAARLKTGPTQAIDTVAREERSAALRRRSWQQVGRVREIEDARAARRERESDAETFPAPRNIVPRM